MVETVFILLIAGCAETAEPCAPLVEAQISAVSRAACEIQLDAEMARQTAPWPEYRGICLPNDQFTALPNWWPPTTTVVARAPRS